MEAKLPIPADSPGKKRFTVYVKSDCYRDFDLVQNVDFEILTGVHTEKKAEYFIHPDDKALLKKPSLWQQMTMGPQAQNDSEEEEEEEEEDQGKEKKSGSPTEDKKKSGEKTPVIPDSKPADQKKTE